MIFKNISITILLLSVVALFGVTVSAHRGKVVNGTQAQNGEFPFVVSLRRAASGRHSCGASMLNRGWVLTAAHCVSRHQPENVNIQYGSNELDVNSTKVANVSKIFVHEEYYPHQQYINDIALLKLKDPIVFGANVKAVHLPEMQQFTPGNSSAVLLGWGLNATGGSIQNQLQKVHLQTYTDEECRARHEATIHNTTICAGVPEGGKGQCSGDSGGPLLVNGTQVGVVSWSRKPCTIAPYPGVFTEVSAYVDWILKTIADEGEDENKGESNESWEQVSSGNLIIVSLRRSTNHGHFCAGTIINSVWILTAAHCFMHVTQPTELRVQYGSSRLQTITAKFANVSEIVKHEGYNPTIAIHDIALLHLSTVMELDGSWNAVELPQTSAIVKEVGDVVLVGWGLNETLGVLQNQLQKTQLQLQSLPACRQQLQAFLHSTQLCAGPGTLAESKGQCSGDSGGPLLQQHTQIGIVSWSLKPCGSYPGVYTNVAYYTDWIYAQIQIT